MSSLTPSKNTASQLGFGLVEVLVGMVIAMFTILAIMQVMTSFEGQKRTTGGVSEAQTNGSIALYTLQRNIQPAGFDLPAYSAIYRPLSCNNEPTIDHDLDAGTPDIGIFPIFITDGGNAAGASDTVTVLGGFDNPAAGLIGQSTSGVPSRITGLSGGNTVSIPNNLGCKINDIALIMQSGEVSPTPACGLKRVTAVVGTTQVALSDTVGIALSDGISCMTGWSQRAYSIANNTLMEGATPIIPDIVNIQAQYGLSAVASDNEVSTWVDATGIWAAPSTANRKLIKAIRIALVARSNLLERDTATGSTLCSSTNTANPTGVCAWEGTAANPAPSINLSNTANWANYRYRVFETIIPLRNVIWNMNVI